MMFIFPSFTFFFYGYFSTVLLLIFWSFYLGICFTNKVGFITKFKELFKCLANIAYMVVYYYAFSAFPIASLLVFLIGVLQTLFYYLFLVDGGWGIASTVSSMHSDWFVYFIFGVSYFYVFFRYHEDEIRGNYISDFEGGNKI
jgi:hypothetical protein